MEGCESLAARANIPSRCVKALHCTDVCKHNNIDTASHYVRHRDLPTGMLVIITLDDDNDIYSLAVTTREIKKSEGDRQERIARGERIDNTVNHTLLIYS